MSPWLDRALLVIETRLEESGLIRCNCPGWIFCRAPPEEKSCTHKRQVQDEAVGILRMFRRFR